MSLLPIFFSDAFVDSPRPSRILHQHFGDFLTPEDLLMPIESDLRRLMGPGYYRPWRAQTTDSGSNITVDKEKFQVNLDVQQFKPEEISVKVTGNNQITVEGKHEEKQDEHGFISRHFMRKYAIPEGHDVEKVVSKLSSDGVLTITAPKAIAAVEEGRNIPITFVRKDENME